MSKLAGEPVSTVQQGKSGWYVYGSFLFAAILIAVSIYTRLRLLPVPLERDEGGFAYIAQQMLHGIPPFESGNMKSLTGLHAAYALILAIFGESATGIHAGLLVINLLSTGLMFLLAKRLIAIEGAALAAGTYAHVSTSQSVLGVFAHATHFVVPFVLAGLILLLKGLREDRSTPIFAAGLCFGTAVEMKQHALFFCLFAFFLLIVQSRAGGGIRHNLKRLLIVALGMFMPYAVNCLYMMWEGVFPEFWFWTFTHSLNYAGHVPIHDGLLNLTSTVKSIFSYMSAPILFGAFGLFATLKCKGSVDVRMFPLSFFLFSFLSVTPGLIFYQHYFVMLLPALSLLVGVAFSAVFQGLSLSQAQMGKSCSVALMGVFLGGFCLCILQEKDYLFRLAPEAVSRKLYGLNPFPEAVRVAEYIRNNSPAHAKVAVLGSEPQIYFYADRASATDYIFIYELNRPHPYLQRMQDEMMSEIELERPEYIIFVGVDVSWLNRMEGDRIINWACNYLCGYRQVGLVEISDAGSIYSWGKSAENKTWPNPSPFLAVFERNETGAEIVNIKGGKLSQTFSE